MNNLFGIFQSIIALGIIIFSFLSCYYGIKILIIHIREHKKIRTCCWLTLIQTISQIGFFILFIFILEELLLKDISVVDIQGFGALFIRPVIFLNNVIVSIYLKTRFINEKNTSKIKKLKEVKNG